MLDSEIQFVHEDDVVEAVTGLLLGRHGGAFNVCGDGLMTMRECAELIESPVRKLPMRAYRALARVMWRLRAVEAPPARSSSRCTRGSCRTRRSSATLGWTPKHTSRETFEITMRAHGKLPPAEPPAPVAATQVPLSETPTTSSASARSL